MIDWDILNSVKINLFELISFFDLLFYVGSRVAWIIQDHYTSCSKIRAQTKAVWSVIYTFSLQEGHDFRWLVLKISARREHTSFDPPLSTKASWCGSLSSFISGSTPEDVKVSGLVVCVCVDLLKLLNSLYTQPSVFSILTRLLFTNVIL